LTVYKDGVNIRAALHKIKTIQDKKMKIQKVTSARCGLSAEPIKPLSHCHTLGRGLLYGWLPHVAAQ
jgi:hypothetical protein